MLNLPVKVCELFISLQGEGVLAGYLTTFIRLSGCNLNCPWCDTKYHSEGNKMSVEAIIDAVDNLQAKFVCITGGEPLIQAGLFGLCRELRLRGKYVVIETNGTLPIDQREANKWVVDYKLPSAKPRIPFFEDNFNRMGKFDELKFVIADRADYDEAKHIATSGKFEGVVLFSPTPETRVSLADWMVADRLNGTKYSLQIHKILWNDRRGK